MGYLKIAACISNHMPSKVWDDITHHLLRATALKFKDGEVISPRT